MLSNNSLQQTAAINMSSFRAMFCNLCIISMFGLLMVFAEDKPNGVLIEEFLLNGNCSCGAFPTTTPEITDQPLLSQMPGLVVKCDDEGQMLCKSLCNALAIATKAKGPEILCNKLKDADELKLSAFAQSCVSLWIYADVTAEEPLCCKDSKVVECPSVANNMTTVVDPKSAM